MENQENSVFQYKIPYFYPLWGACCKSKQDKSLSLQVQVEEAPVQALAQALEQLAARMAAQAPAALQKLAQVLEQLAAQVAAQEPVALQKVAHLLCACVCEPLLLTTLSGD